MRFSGFTSVNGLSKSTITSLPSENTAEINEICLKSLIFDNSEFQTAYKARNLKVLTVGIVFRSLSQRLLIAVF